MPQLQRFSCRRVLRNISTSTDRCKRWRQLCGDKTASGFCRLWKLIVARRQLSKSPGVASAPQVRSCLQLHVFSLRKLTADTVFVVVTVCVCVLCVVYCSCKSRFVAHMCWFATGNGFSPANMRFTATVIFQLHIRSPGYNGVCAHVLCFSSLQERLPQFLHV